MSDREDRFEKLQKHARDVVRAESTETFDELADWLRANAITNDRGLPYTGGRGVARLISAAYDYFCYGSGGGPDEARPIYCAFTNRHGDHLESIGKRLVE